MNAALWTLLIGAVYVALSRREEITSAIEWGAEIVGNLTRGERNNNPGNLVKGVPWRGLAPSQPDSRFASFVAPEWGIRALAKDLLNDFNVDGKRTVAELIAEFAPPSENVTSAYIGAVSDALGVDPRAPINLNDPGTLEQFITAVIQHENGRVIYDRAQIVAGIQGATGNGPYA